MDLVREDLGSTEPKTKVAPPQRYHLFFGILVLLSIACVIIFNIIIIIIPGRAFPTSASFAVTDRARAELRVEHDETTPTPVTEATVPPIWLRFLRRCAEENVELLLLREDLVRLADSTPRLSSEWLVNLTHLGVFEDRVATLENIVVEGEFGPGNGSLLDARALVGAVETPLVQGFAFFFGTRNSINVSVVFERRNPDEENEGYFWMPWSPRGVAMAFPPFETRPVVVGDFDETFRAPANAEKFLWEAEAGEFIACDAERNEAFRRKSEMRTTLNWKKNGRRIESSMRLIVALRKTMAAWRKRNWIASGTLLGWYRQCSIIPHDHDMDSEQRIEDFEDWMIDFFRNHTLLKLLARFGLKEDSLEFKLGNYDNPFLDLFWVYSHRNFSWIGFQVFDENLTKMIAYYPPLGRICSGDLHGYLVYVPCNVEDIVKLAYGPKWFETKAAYDYSVDGHNFQTNGTWTKEQWKEAYQTFG